MRRRGRGRRGGGVGWGRSGEGFAVAEADVEWLRPELGE